MKTKLLFGIVLFAVINGWATQSCKPCSSKSATTVSVNINYGETKASRTIELPLQSGETALEILQRAATVETHPVGKHVFVTAIDGVKGERGVTAWYYKVNGESPKKLAISNVINGSCTIEWLYQKDRCSATVDK